MSGWRVANLWLLAYLPFVVYGSLVPLDFRPMPPGQAWPIFQQIPFLRSASDRAPTGSPTACSTCRWASCCHARAGSGGRTVGLGADVALCAALATGVEFAQLFFPPRTVSQNDLLAEYIGSAWGQRWRWCWPVGSTACTRPGTPAGSTSVTACWRSTRSSTWPCASSPTTCCCRGRNWRTSSALRSGAAGWCCRTAAWP